MEGSRQAGLLALALLASSSVWIHGGSGNRKAKLTLLLLVLSVLACVAMHLVSGYEQGLIYEALATGTLGVLAHKWVLPSLIAGGVQFVTLAMGLVLGAILLRTKQTI